ncbi:sugar ABC transporter ATP-binding protein [Planctomycetota bacterium]
MANQDYILEIKDISKSFPGVKALNNVSIRIKPGTIHALIGENGAGKSTLMRILIGIYSKYDGEIFLHRHKVAHKDVGQALDLGISMIHQELTYVPYMTIAENIFLGKEPSFKLVHWIKSKELYRKTKELLQKVELNIDPNRLMKDLSVAERQMVEIAKALSYHSEIIIMDEPTSALSEREVERLFSIFKDMKARGVTVIYISHKLDEIFQIADEVTVLRDGNMIATYKISQVNAETLVSKMVGRKLTDIFPRQTVQPGKGILTVKNLGKKGVFQNISFTVHEGEILGLAGLMGAGRTEVIRCIFGLDKYDKGQIFIGDQEVKITKPSDAIKLGLGLASEDRKVTGLIPCLSIRKNITLSNLNLCSLGPMVLQKREKKLVDRMITDLTIKTPGREQKVVNLSGGNQQKVVLGKALLSQPDILILDEPTRGIDVGAKSEIYKLMRDLADQGKAIIMISSELEEILGMSDRIIILHNGKITGRLCRDEANQEKIMKYAIAE